MSDHSSTEIERSLERERVALAQSLVALRDRLRPANLVAEGKTALMDQAAPVLSRVDGAVRSHPVMAAVAGVALAGLVFGRRHVADAEAAAAVPAMAGTKFEALTRWEDEGGPPAPEPVDPDETWLSEARNVRDTARNLLKQIDDAARRGLAPAAQLAKHRADVLLAVKAETTRALGKGLGSLTGAARDQALQARERIYLGRIAMAEKGRETVDANPLMVGAALAVAGAAVAMLFPRTETEDKLMGETRDQLAADMKAMVRREAVKASALGSTLTAALKTDLKQASRLFTPAADDRPIRHH